MWALCLPSPGQLSLLKLRQCLCCCCLAGAAEDAASSSQKSQGLLFPRGMLSFHVTGSKRSKSTYVLSLSATHPPVAKVLCWFRWPFKSNAFCLLGSFVCFFSSRCKTFLSLAIIVKNMTIKSCGNWGHLLFLFFPLQWRNKWNHRFHHIFYCYFCTFSLVIVCDFWCCHVFFLFLACISGPTCPHFLDISRNFHWNTEANI